jgi:thioredoxin-related protein
MRMRLFSVFILGIIVAASVSWETDFNMAKQKAKQEHKFILLNFSGSDWCGPCIRMHKDIFESTAFKEYAGTNLVLVNADFPRMKKNQLSKEQQKQNDKLAEKYNSQGIFPVTLLLDAEGNVIKNWDGLPNLSPEEFTTQVKAAADARK